MFIIAIALILGFIYWFIENHSEKTKTHFLFKNTQIPHWIIGGIKWSSVALLIYTTINIQSTIHIIKTTILILYSIGDFIIIYSDSTSIVFFLAGNLMIVTHFITRMFWDLLVTTHLHLLAWLVTSITIASIACIVFNVKRKDLPSTEISIYFVYIFSLGLILTLPLIFFDYIGGLFFVLSDIILGFKILQLRKLTFPLYFASLICILYFL